MGSKAACSVMSYDATRHSRFYLLVFIISSCPRFHQRAFYRDNLYLSYLSFTTDISYMSYISGKTYIAYMPDMAAQSVIRKLLLTINLLTCMICMRYPTRL